jgi:hypothetical protein
VVLTSHKGSYSCSKSPRFKRDATVMLDVVTCRLQKIVDINFPFRSVEPSHITSNHEQIYLKLLITIIFTIEGIHGLSTGKFIDVNYAKCILFVSTQR